jgi:hypothetical protein
MVLVEKTNCDDPGRIRDVTAPKAYTGTAGMAA